MTGSEGFEPSRRLTLAARAEALPVLNAHGEVGNGRSRGDKNENVISTRGSNSADYRISKLKRDFPEVAERMNSCYPRPNNLRHNWDSVLAAGVSGSCTGSD